LHLNTASFDFGLFKLVYCRQFGFALMAALLFSLGFRRILATGFFTSSPLAALL